MKSVIFALFATILLTTISYGASNEINARYTHLQCRQTLAAAQAAELAKYVTAPSMDNLNADMVELKKRADTGIGRDFNNYIKNTIMSDFKNFQTELKTARAGLKNAQITKENRQALKDAWKSAVESFSQCNTNAQKDLVAARSQTISDDVTKWDAEVANMKSKGLDTTEEEAVITDAKALVTKLDGMATSDDATFKTQLDEARDSHLHIWARFHAARLTSYLGKIKADAIAKGYAAQVSQIEDLLNSAKAMALPGKKYPENGFLQTWQNIRDAQTKLRDITKALKGVQQ